jgi:hypothetical protein
MRLVHASYKREIFAVVLVAALGLIVCLIASGAPDADARPRTATAVIPDGTYGAARLSRGEYVVFKVQNHRVRDLEFQFQITCETSDMPGTEQRFFTSGMAPQNHIVPPNGKVFMHWWERGNGRRGYVSAELKFGARDVANFSVIVPEDPSVAPGEGAESCNGVGSLRFHRGYELPPIPSP